MYFVIVAIVAGTIAWVLTSSYQQTLTAILLMLSLVAGVMSPCRHTVSDCLAIGSVEKILFKPEGQTHSPLAHETMPPQIIPPLSND